jgi:hypothetical protein
MAEQSHRDEMNAAIRAQRERQAASPAPEPAEPEPQQEHDEAKQPAAAVPPRKSLLDRLRGR